MDDVENELSHIKKSKFNMHPVVRFIRNEIHKQGLTLTEYCRRLGSRYNKASRSYKQPKFLLTKPHGHHIGVHFAYHTLNHALNVLGYEFRICKIKHAKIKKESLRV